MRTLLGRGFSDPAASLFVEDGKGFLGNPDADRPLPGWLSEADLSYFSEIYRKSGFRGGLNWYRNIDRNWELTAPCKARNPSTVTVHCRIERFRHYRLDRRQTGG